MINITEYKILNATTYAEVNTIDCGTIRGELISNINHAVPYVVFGMLILMFYKMVNDSYNIVIKARSQEDITKKDIISYIWTVIMWMLTGYLAFIYYMA